MIYRSVVGKLWMTIIVLVALVLAVFSLFLNQRIEKTYYIDQEKSLRQFAEEIQQGLAKSDQNNHSFYLEHVLKVSRLFHVYIAILNRNGTVKPLPNSNANQLTIQWKDILEPDDLKKVLQGETLSWIGNASIKETKDQDFSVSKHDVILVAAPYRVHNQVEGAILLYQAQEELSGFDIKRWIFYSACIGILLTTIFAFFLSTRITQPLLQMKEAAEKMTRGQFSTRVPVRIHERDEIADLSMAFNRMASQLEESIRLLSQEKEQLASILRSMSDGVITLDAKGKVTLTNPPADQLLQLFQKDHKKKGLLPDPLDRFYRQVVNDHKEQIGDISIRGYTFAVVMAPLYERNQVRGVVAVTRDVTEERRLDKLRKDFVANVSHELRTPLSMLQGYSEALIDDIADTSEARKEIAEVINEESQRMGRLVRELLDLARMESGHIYLDVHRIPLDRFLYRVLRKFQSISTEQEVALSGQIEKDLPEVYWDEDKIEQVLTNLIDNAIRHTPAGGKVEVAVQTNSEQIIIMVKDTGSGIPEEDLPFIFERFYKADKARTRGQSGGTGLGLSIAKHLVTAHQGQIQVTSRLGKGTTFTLLLPIRAKSDKM